ncbi:unnamed protein product [Oppiella nova]|uniref:C2H2-type domain-containing protein n=1 Tax=Oppiella nova TaxID=334625 RepID=A0A7R9LZ28_9ACAR|nr:unnamed protein product [Oppiella nova]CAG2168093.1 unnamed protein product [Oppiella nova]
MPPKVVSIASRQSSVDNVLMKVMAIMTTKRVLLSSLNPTRSDDQRNEESIGDQEVVIKSEDNPNNGSSDEEMCETSQDIHSTEGLFVCSVNDCQYSCQMKAGFTRHQLIRHPDAFPDIPWIECSHTGCQYRCKDRNNYNQHVIRHVKPFECSQCGQTFAQNYGLMLHTRRRHTLPVRVGARGFGKTRVTKSRHKLQTIVSQDIQLTEGLFACSLNGCQNTFEFKQNLSRHHLVIHPDAFPDIPWIQCQYTGCEYRTKHNHTMRQHSYKHTKPFKCSRCGQTFATNIGLRLHSMKQDCQLISQTNEQTVESQEVTTNEELNEDQEVVLKSGGHRDNGSNDTKMCDKPKVIQTKDGLFMCLLNDCQNTFELKQNYTRHQLVVHPDAFPHKPWIQCSHTGCQFRTKHGFSMTQHWRTHVKPFVCTHCGQGFKSNRDLKVHSKKQHNNESVRVRTRGSGCGNTSVNKSGLKSQTNRPTVGTQDVNTNEELIGDQEVVIKLEDIQSVEDLFVCSLNGCEFSSRRKPDFNRHQLVVHPEVFPHKPWLKCPQTGCQFRTKHKGTLTQHLYRHKIPLKCTHCGQTFPTNFALKHHFQRNHNKELMRARTRRSTCGKSTINKSRPKPQTSELTVESQDVITTEKSINELESDSNVTQSDSDLQASEELHVCHYMGCEQSFRNRSQLTQHRRLAHSTGTHRCLENGCSAEFSTWVGLRTHRIHQHPTPFRQTSDGLYVCGYVGCTKTYTSMASLTVHKYTHSAHKTYRCDVEGCSAKYTSPHYLYAHRMQKHSTKYRCDWEGCDYKTGDKFNFDKHQLIVHSGERQFTCPVEECLQTFKTKSDVTQHQLKRHPDSVPDVPWIHCTHTDCQFKNKSDYAMKAHLKQHTKHYRCDECGKWFTHLSELKYHAPTHDKSLQYPCEWPGCEKRFITKGGMTVHMGTHSGERKYRCSWPGCGKNFKEKAKLKEHEVLHKDPMKYQCQWPGCGKVYMSQTKLKDHDMVHKDPTKYRCHWPGCNRQLGSRNSFNVHMKEHTGTRRFRCQWPGCSYNTHFERSLKNHIKNSHKE